MWADVARRWAIALVCVVGLGVVFAATFEQWPAWVVWLTVAASIGLVSALSVRPRRTRPGSGDAGLYASDAYSDAYRGRARPTHPHSDAQASSQIIDPPPHDPLRPPD